MLSSLYPDSNGISIIYHFNFFLLFLIRRKNSLSVKEAHFTLPISHLAYASHTGASPRAGTQVEQWRSEENHWCTPSGRKPPLQEQTPHGFLSNSQWKHFYLLSFLLLKLNPTIQGVETWNHWMDLAASSSLRSHRPFRRQRAHQYLDSREPPSSWTGNLKLQTPLYESPSSASGPETWYRRMFSKSWVKMNFF